MNWMHRYISRRTAMIWFNLVLLFGMWAKGLLEYTADSIITCVLTMTIMNYVAWYSTRHFPDWR